MANPYRTAQFQHGAPFQFQHSFSMLAMLAAQTAALLPQPAPRTAMIDMSIDMD